MEHKISLDISIDRVYQETIEYIEYTEICSSYLYVVLVHWNWCSFIWSSEKVPVFASSSLSSLSLTFWKWRAGVQLEHSLCFRNTIKACSDVGSISLLLPGMQEPQTSLVRLSLELWFPLYWQMSKDCSCVHVFNYWSSVAWKDSIIKHPFLTV